MCTACLFHLHSPSTLFFFSQVSDNQSEVEVVTINFQENVELDMGEVDAPIEVHGHTAYALPFKVKMSGDLPEATDYFFATEAEYTELLRRCNIRYVTTTCLVFCLTVIINITGTCSTWI